MSKEKLEVLNRYRVAEGKKPLPIWRARNGEQLDAYEIAANKADEEQARADAEYARRKEAEEKAKAEREAEEARLIEEANKPVRKPKGEKVKSASEIAKVAASADFGDHKELQAAAKEAAKGKSYKQVANYDKSVISKPVSFVHQFLTDNPGLSRKEAVIALTEGYGVNFSTARTQYQRWFSENKKGA